MTAAALILALCVAAAAEPGFEFASPSDGAVYEGGIGKEILISGRIAGADDLPNNAEYICFALQRPPGALFESSDGRCVLLRTAIAERLYLRADTPGTHALSAQLNTAAMEAIGGTSTVHFELAPARGSWLVVGEAERGRHGDAAERQLAEPPQVVHGVVRVRRRLEVRPVAACAEIKVSRPLRFGAN